MKKFTKILSLILTLLMAASMLFACADDLKNEGNDDTDQNEENNSSDEKDNNSEEDNSANFLSPSALYEKLRSSDDVVFSAIYESSYDNETFRDSVEVFKDQNKLKYEYADDYGDGEIDRYTEYGDLETNTSYIELDGVWYYLDPSEFFLSDLTLANLLEDLTYHDPETLFNDDSYTLKDGEYVMKDDIARSLYVASASDDNFTVSVKMSYKDGVHTVYSCYDDPSSEYSLDITFTVKFEETGVTLPENALRYEDIENSEEDY